MVSDSLLDGAELLKGSSCGSSRAAERVEVQGQRGGASSGLVFLQRWNIRWKTPRQSPSRASVARAAASPALPPLAAEAQTAAQRSRPCTHLDLNSTTTVDFRLTSKLPSTALDTRRPA